MVQRQRLVPRSRKRGPAEAVTVQWRLLLEGLHQESNRFAHARSTLTVAQAAYDEPTLRQLYPFLSHGSLHLSTCTGFRYSWNVPFVDPLSDGRYRVGGPSRGIVIGEADTAPEAITMVVDGLPAGCGPAVAGAADDQQQSRSGAVGSMSR